MTTASKTYDLHGAKLIATVNIYPLYINVCLTLDVSVLNKPEHNQNNLVDYLNLPEGYRVPPAKGWERRSRSVQCKTGAQSRRIIERDLIKLDDAVSEALIARQARQLEIGMALP